MSYASRQVRYQVDPKARGPQGGRSKEEQKIGYEERRFFRKYGITIEDRNRLLKEQGGRCAICHVELTTGHGPASMATDHCHTTKTIRGILCAHCNTGLGLFKDRIDLLDSAREYLLRSRR